MVRGIVLGIVFAISACGGSSDDDGGSGGSGGSSGGSGGSGGTAQIDPECRVSNCPMQLQPYEDPGACANFKSDMCFDEARAWYDCYLDNEECGSDGKQVRASLEPCDDLKQIAADCTL